MRDHGMLWGIAPLLSLFLGWLDYETTTRKILLCNKVNLVTLLIYTVLYSLFVFVAFNIFKIRVEEPRLRKDFGEEYKRYREKVKRWF